MASYKEAVEWIALNDAAGDTRVEMSFSDAFEAVDAIVTVCLVADLWNKDQRAVAVDVLKARGFVAPRGFLTDMKGTKA